MKKPEATLLLIFLLTFFGACIRLLGYPNIPLSVNRDEAALGFNALSLVQTGTDEWQQTWPFTFRSFGDIKLPGYIYTLVPLVGIWGLNAATVRLPALLAGVALVPLTYFFLRLLHLRKQTSLLAAGLVAVSPWAVHYSTTAYEATLALACFMAGLTMLLKSVNRWWLLLLSGMFLFFSLCTYNAPLLILAPIGFWLFLNKRLGWSQLLLVIFVSVLAFLFVMPATKGKTGISIVTDQYIAGERDRLGSRTHNIWTRIKWRKEVIIAHKLAEHHVSAFSPNFLVFGNGTNPWHKVGSLGHIHVLVYIFFLLGMGATLHTCIVKRKASGKTAFLLLGLLFLSPLPASITQDAPHATRSLFFLLLTNVMAGVTASFFIDFLRKKVSHKPALFFFSALFFCFLGFTVVQQRLQLKPEEYASEWMVGIQQRLHEAKMLEPQATIGVVGDVHYTYVYPLFYLQIPANFFQQTVQYYPPDSIGLSRVRAHTSFYFVDDVQDLPRSIKMYIYQDGTKFSLRHLE